MLVFTMLLAKYFSDIKFLLFLKDSFLLNSNSESQYASKSLAQFDISNSCRFFARSFSLLAHDFVMSHNRTNGVRMSSSMSLINRLLKLFAISNFSFSCSSFICCCLFFERSRATTIIPIIILLLSFIAVLCEDITTRLLADLYISSFIIGSPVLIISASSVMASVACLAVKKLVGYCPIASVGESSPKNFAWLLLHPSILPLVSCQKTCPGICSIISLNSTMVSWLYCSFSKECGF